MRLPTGTTSPTLLLSTRRRLAKVRFNPLDPAPLHVALPHRVTRVVPVDRIRDELRRHAVVLQRMIQLERLGRRYAEVLRVGHYKGWRPDLGGVGDRRLLDVSLHPLRIR